MWKQTLAGAGSGFGAGIILPGIGSVVGAIVGGAAGYLSALLGNNDRQQEYYQIDLGPFKKEVEDQVNQVVNQVMNDLNDNIEKVNASYLEFVDKQMSKFIQDLKDQMDKMLSDYNHNKTNLVEYMKTMQDIVSYGENLLGRIERARVDVRLVPDPHRGDAVK